MDLFTECQQGIAYEQFQEELAGIIDLDVRIVLILIPAIRFAQIKATSLNAVWYDGTGVFVWFCRDFFSQNVVTILQ